MAQIVPPSVSHMSKEFVKAELKQTVKRIIMDGITGKMDSYNANPTVGWNQASIASYLRNKGYDYSLSVFLAESEVSPDKIQQITSTGKTAGRNNSNDNKILFEVWEKLEEKYSGLLKQRINEMESELSTQVNRVENILRRKIQEEENTLKKIYGRKLDELETKEREMEDVYERRQQNAESEIENERKELLRQIREVEIRRRELGKVETQLDKQIKNEIKNLHQMREELTNFEADLRRRELEVNLILERRTQQIRADEQAKYKQKLSEFIAREEKLKRLIEQAKSSNNQHETFQFLLKERDNRILALEEALERQKQENIQLVQQLLLSNEKLKEISLSAQDISKIENTKLSKDLENLNEKLQIANVEYKQLQRESQNEIKQLQFELAAANSMISESEFDVRNNLNKKIDQLRIQLDEQNDDWKAKLTDQKFRYDELKKHWQFENERTQHLTQEVNKLRKKNLKDNILKKPSSKRIVINNFNGSDDETSRDSPPDFVKDAQTRLQQLEQEAKDFDLMLNKYRDKEIKASAKLIRNSGGSTMNVQKLNNNYLEYQQFNDLTAYIPNSVPAVQAVPVLGPYSANKIVDTVKVVEEEPKQTIQAKETRHETTVQRFVPESIPAKITETAAAPSVADVISEPAKFDDWEARLKARDEERRKRDEELLKKQQAEIIEVKPETVVVPTAPVINQPVTPAAATVDPIMEKYMQMVLEQKRQQQAQNEKTETGDVKPVVTLTRTEPKDEDIEVASLERPSSSEFEW